jgi:hypothetical protein
MTACEKAQSGYRCTLQIERVEGYGAATPVINTSAPLTVRASSPVVAQFERNGVFTLRGVESVIFSLSHAQGPSVGTDRASAWQIDDVHLPPTQK